MIAVSEAAFGRTSDAIVIGCGANAADSSVAHCVELATRLGVRHLVVDLGSREGAPSELLDVLHRSAKALREAGGGLAVVCSAPGLRRLLDVTLLNRSFSVYPTRAEALARLSGGMDVAPPDDGRGR